VNDARNAIIETFVIVRSLNFRGGREAHPYRSGGGSGGGSSSDICSDDSDDGSYPARPVAFNQEQRARSLSDKQQLVEVDDSSEHARQPQEQVLQLQQQEQVLQLQQLENRLELTQQRLERAERQMAAMAQAHVLEIQKLEEAAAARQHVSVATHALAPADFDGRVVSMPAEISHLGRRLEADGAESAAAAHNPTAAEEGLQNNSHNAGRISMDIQDNTQDYSAADTASGPDVQQLHDHLRCVTQQLAEARAKADSFEVNRAACNHFPL
jgi:chromosome segregation ATPase